MRERRGTAFLLDEGGDIDRILGGAAARAIGDAHKIWTVLGKRGNRILYRLKGHPWLRRKHFKG
jgi:hypothetical protein